MEIWRKLDFQGEHYTHTLMTPMFTPPPMDAELPPIYVSGLGPGMAKIAGEVADGFCSYIPCAPWNTSKKLLFLQSMREQKN